MSRSDRGGLPAPPQVRLPLPSASRCPQSRGRGRSDLFRAFLGRTTQAHNGLPQQRPGSLKTEPGASKPRVGPGGRTGRARNPVLWPSRRIYRRDSHDWVGRSDGAMHWKCEGASTKKPAVELTTAGDLRSANLPRSPTGLAVGFGTRKCAAKLALRSPLCRPTASANLGGWWSADGFGSPVPLRCQSAGIRPSYSIVLPS